MLEPLQRVVRSANLAILAAREPIDQLQSLGRRDLGAIFAAIESGNNDGARYLAQPTGFTFSTEGLRFRLPSGVEAQPGNFTLTRRLDPGKPPHAEVRADGIDLKIAATLIDYFPLPRDIKGQVQRFAPRGQLKNASLTWSGDAVTPA